MGRAVDLAIAMSFVAVGVLVWRGATVASQPPPPAAEQDPIRAATQPSPAEPDPITPAAQPTGAAPSCSSPGPATPTPFNGATEESTGPSSGPQDPADVAPLDTEADVSAEDVCADVAGPTPVIAEAPTPVLLPLTASLALAGALWLVRRRADRRGAVAGREAADGE